MASVALGNAAFSARDAALVFLSVTGAPSAIQFGTGVRRDALVVDKMRHALAAALAVPVLWASTVAFPVMGLVYCLTMVALDSLEHLVRRLQAARRWGGRS